MEPLPTPDPQPWRPSVPFTRDDLDRMPDDGHRYELVDGTLLVSPSPRIRHQDVLLAIYRLLFAGCPPELKVTVAPFAVVLSEDTIVEPDVLVAPRDAFAERDLPGPPLLAVEVLSPSTRRFDLMLKWSRYQDAGVAAYWVVDPDTPTLIVWELRDGAFAQVAKVTGDESVRLAVPFDVTIVPADLVS